MWKFFALAGAILLVSASSAVAQGRNTDRTIGPELNRDRAETRIERLRQDQRQQQDKPGAARAQKLQPSSTTQQPR
jgi:hypothetical protein